eukprot:7592388-Prorocentrum_lima.AAC.1
MGQYVGPGTRWVGCGPPAHLPPSPPDGNAEWVVDADNHAAQLLVARRGSCSPWPTSKRARRQRTPWMCQT